MSYEQHQQSAAAISARCALITLSDTRNESTDTSGQRISALLRESNHSIAQYKIIHDDATILRHLVDELLARNDIDVILTNGGTGISQRDQTIAALEKTLEQPLPGFGELFRMLSYDQIGSGAMLSRAVGGIAKGKLIFAMPGSTKAVELAMTKLILPELKHLLHELRKHAST
jgi:molybdenum cofactor biosynthesis protein B